MDVPDLDKQLEGARAGETRTFSVTVPETNPAEAIRGKQVEIEVAVKEIKKLELAEITPEVLADLGFENETQLRDALKEQMLERIKLDVQTAMRDQVNKFLLDNTTMELPTKLSEKQEARVVSRRATDLVMRGLPRDQVAQNIDRLRGGAKDEAIRKARFQPFVRPDAVQARERPGD